MLLSNTNPPYYKIVQKQSEASVQICDLILGAVEQEPGCKPRGAEK